MATPKSSRPVLPLLKTPQATSSMFPSSKTPVSADLPVTPPGAYTSFLRSNYTTYSPPQSTSHSGTQFQGHWPSSATLPPSTRNPYDAYSSEIEKQSTVPCDLSCPYEQAPLSAPPTRVTFSNLTFPFISCSVSDVYLEIVTTSAMAAASGETTPQILTSTSSSLVPTPISATISPHAGKSTSRFSWEKSSLSQMPSHEPKISTVSGIADTRNIKLGVAVEDISLPGTSIREVVKRVITLTPRIEQVPNWKRRRLNKNSLRGTEMRNLTDTGDSDDIRRMNSVIPQKKGDVVSKETGGIRKNDNEV